jgi:uncharacterized membrane protein YedE/YeeE
METTHETIHTQRPFIAGFWLIPAIPVFAFIVLPIMMRLGVDDLYSPAGVTVMFIVHFAAGYMWARSIGIRSGLPRNRAINIFGGFGFAFGVVGLLILYVADFPIENAINPWVESFEGAGNLEFGALFAPWTGLACGISGFALGLGLRDLKLALKLLALGFITGLGLYLAIMFTMELLGFKVGSGRPVMLPTTFLSVWSTALVGSALFGKLLAKANEQ